MTSGEKPKSAVWVPLVVGDEVRGDHLAPEHRPRGRLQRLRRRAPDDARRQPQRRARERPPDRRDPPAARRAGDGQRGRPGALEPARPRRAARARRRADATDVRGRHLLRRAPRRRRTDQIEFPYFHESGEPAASGAVRLRRGADVADPAVAREPLLLNRAGGLGRDRRRRASGTQAKSYLGVPILAGDTAIGVDQRPEHDTRGPLRRVRRAAAVDDRRERRRRDPERPALPGGPPPRRRDGGPGRGRPGDLGDARRPGRPRADRRAGPRPCSRPTRRRCSSPSRTAGTFRAILAIGELADALRADTILEGEGIIGDVIRTADARVRQRRRCATPRTVDIPGTEDHNPSIERLMVAPLIARDRVTGVAAVWRTEGEPFAQADLDFLVGLARQASIAIENARLFADAQEAHGRGRGREPGEERVPRRDEPRDPDADERGHRDERPAPRDGARRRAARLRRDDPDVRRRAAHDHQRHPRLLEDRGGQGRPRSRAVLAARRRSRAPSTSSRRSPAKQGRRARLRDGRRPAGGDRRRRRPAPPDRPQPPVERDQVHRAGRGRPVASRRREPADGRRRRGRSTSTSGTPASASRRSGWTCSSSRSARSTRRSRGATAGRASAWRSAGASPSRWAAR